MVFNRFGSTTAAVTRRLVQPPLLLAICCGLMLAGGPGSLPAQQPENPPPAEPPVPQLPADDVVPTVPTAGSGSEAPTPGSPAAAPKSPSDAGQPATEPATPQQEPAGRMTNAPQQPPAAARSPQQTAAPAADGTVSVVVTAPANPAPASAPTASDPIQPAANPPTTAAATAAASTPAAATLLEQVLKPLEGRPQSGSISNPAAATLYARPLPLLEALQRSGDRSRRLWITQAYWKVSAAYSSLRLAAEAVEQLELIAPGRDPHDRGLLDVASAGAQADLAEAEAGLIAAQQQLVDLVRLPVSEPLPWPVDQPLTGPYETHFAAIFATRPATGRIRAIDRMLPRRHESVEARATAVLAAARAMARAEADHARGTRPIEAVLAAHRMLRQQQQQFLDSLATYNLDIAEYAMAVADLTVPDEQYVSMLIETPVPWNPQPPANLIPATNLQPIAPQIVPTP